MLGVWIGAIQNMYPELGAGVEDHSILLREPLQRVARSVFPIMGVVYDGDRAAETGAQIRGYHETIKGVDAAGRRYHALNPETFYWAHATFFMLILKTAEYFCGGLAEAEKRQLFDEHVQWYRMYGMSMRPVPRTWEDFCEYWERTCRNELEINRATLDIFAIRIPKRSLTHCRTKRLGAVSRNRPARSAQASGRIQVAYCWGVSSRSNAARQAAQAAGVGDGCKGRSAFCDALSGLPERPLRAPGKVTEKRRTGARLARHCSGARGSYPQPPRRSTWAARCRVRRRGERRK